MGNINTELGIASTTSISLNQTNVRTLLGRTVNASTISMSDGYSKSNTYSTAASGGTIIDSGGYRYHIFNTSGTFTVSKVGYPSGSIDYLVIAGGASGGRGLGGGGGAGGYLTGSLALAATSYTITVGAGGPGFTSATAGNNGSDSSAFGVTATGGGGGGNYDGGSGRSQAKTGGSGGGGSTYGGAAGITGQGNAGGTGYASTHSTYGGGGGAGGAGGAGGGNGNTGRGGDGGLSLTWLDGVARAGGGGGSAYSNGTSYGDYTGNVYGGASKAGLGVYGNSSDASPNTGSGSGGTYANQSAAVVGSGASGVVIIRYPYA